MSTVTATATRTSGTAAGSDSARYLTFTLNGEAYALDILHVSEILEHRHLTTVPMMPEFIRGVINLRGRAVPVIDLATRFTGGTTTVARRTCIVIVHLLAAATAGTTDGSGSAGQDLGILVDAVNKVADLADEDIQPPPPFGTGVPAQYISGMARNGEDFIIVLNVNHLLSTTDRATLTDATARGGPDGEAASARPDAP